MAPEEAHVAEPENRWLVPVGAAASVALVGALIWGVANTGGGRPATPAVATTTVPTATQTAPEAAPAVGPTPDKVVPPDAVNGTGSAATTPAALPAYFVGATSPTGKRFGLYREFVRTSVPVGATTAQKARAAVAVAMHAGPFTGYEPYLQPWSHTSVRKVTVTSRRITITLSGPGADGFSAAQTRLAVQELVWTAQAAVGQGTTPVRFVVANGSSTLFGTYPTARTYNRPAKELQYRDLAPIWISSPIRGQVLAAQAPVVATGESCVFEGTTRWKLSKGAKTVRSGVATASSGCPTRGTWRVKLGVLAAGRYTFRMSEASMEGHGVVAETSKPFTVR